MRGGLPIGDTIFPRPTHVNSPLLSRLDRLLLRELEWLREAQSILFRHVMRAGMEFLNSYHNIPSVDLHSRVFAQAMAFAILLDLPGFGTRRSSVRPWAVGDWHCTERTELRGIPSR
jgi:hypothetical protein